MDTHSYGIGRQGLILNRVISHSVSPLVRKARVEGTVRETKLLQQLEKP